MSKEVARFKCVATLNATLYLKCFTTLNANRFRGDSLLSPHFTLEANILIRVPGDEKGVKGSLCFNYMIPVPNECIKKLVIKDIEDEKYRILVNKEYRFCMNHADRIQRKANKIRKMVTMNSKQVLTDNSCAFHILEAGYREYIKNNCTH